MQGHMSEGDPTATADTRECDQEAAAEAKKPTELGSSPTAAAPPVAPPVAPKKQTACAGDSGGWGEPACRVMSGPDDPPSGWGVESRQTPAKRPRQTPAKRARQVFLDMIEVAENRKYAAQRDFDEACDAWVDADSQRC